MIQVNQNFVDSYFKETKRQEYFKKAIKINQHLSFHIDGYEYGEQSQDGLENPYFNILIAERRPNENPTILDYRKKIYLSKTTQPCFKVINSLKKIVKSQDWKIDYSKAEVPSITKNESLENYCEQGYPVFKSLENWVYTYALQYVLTDPNSLIYVEPVNWDIDETEKWKPLTKFVPSSKLFDYKEGEYAVFETDRTETVYDKGVPHVLPINMVMTKDAIIDLVPVDLKNNYRIIIKWEHNLNKLFCDKSGGLYKEYTSGNPLYVSFLNPMISGFDAVAREVSDLDAEVVQHIFSTMWYISGNDCKNCKGTGQVFGVGFMHNKGQQMICPKCDGNGRLLKSPFKDIVVNQKLGEGTTPIPPAGYIQKNTDIVKLQDERIKNHIFDSLSSLNMEFLAQTPLNQSGVAKEVDKDELNNYVYSIAYHIVENILNPIYSMICDMRYSELVPDADVRKTMLPTINIPEKYDLLSSNTLIANYKIAKDANLDQNVVNEIENDIINKVFNNEADTRNRLLLIKQLDPLIGLSMEDKSSMLMNGTIKKEDLIISNYVTQFVTEAINTNDKFMQLSYDEQKKIINEMAEAKELDEVKELKSAINPMETPEEKAQREIKEAAELENNK